MDGLERFKFLMIKRIDSAINQLNDIKNSLKTIVKGVE